MAVLEPVQCLKGNDFYNRTNDKFRKRDVKEMPDGWTIVTKDRSLSAQWEHTILVTENGYEVMTISTTALTKKRFQ